MDLTLRDLALANTTRRDEEKKEKQQPTFKQGDLVAELPCGHSFCLAYLERSMEGRAEGELPLCPACYREFKMDQIKYAIVAE